MFSRVDSEHAVDRPRPRRRVPGLMVICSFVAAPPVEAQSLRGRLTDSLSAQPIGAATLTLLDATTDSVIATTVVEANGVFNLQAPHAGWFRLRVHAAGYRPRTSEVFRLEGDETEGLALSLAPMPRTLDPVTATAERPTTGRLAEFWRRGGTRGWGVS